MKKIFTKIIQSAFQVVKNILGGKHGGNMNTYFKQLETNIPILKSATQSSGEIGFFVQELLRFYSIAGTLHSSGISLNENAKIEERYITHILSRSLLENYFAIIYIFDDPNKTADRYEELKNSFKEDYRKLMNNLSDPSWQTFMLTHSAKLEAADPTWTATPRLPDVNTMLTGLRNNYGDRLSYLYPIYRISSFDTHGRSLATIFEAIFQKPCNFPVLNVRYALELMAEQYVVTLNNLRQMGHKI